MHIIYKNKNIFCGNLKAKCAFGKKGVGFKKREGDLITPIGIYKINQLFYRKDRVKNLYSKIKKKIIRKNMGWCNDPKNKKYYNKLIKIKKKIKHEILYRKDFKYDFIIPIKYNTKNIKLKKGSAIFIHLTKNYTKTLGCVALKKNDFLILLRLINKKTKIKII